jgi:hypothetical protein
MKILFPEIENISLANHTFNENMDSTRIVPVLLYKSNEGIEKPSDQNQALWLKKRLVKNKIETFRAPRTTPIAD